MFNYMKETTETLQLHLPTTAAGRLAHSYTDVVAPTPITSWTAEAGL